MGLSTGRFPLRFPTETRLRRAFRSFMLDAGALGIRGKIAAIVPVERTAISLSSRRGRSR